MRKKNLLEALALLILINVSIMTKAQEINISKVDSLAGELDQTKTDISLMKKLKISGYLQGQYQVADSMGISSFAGGNFPVYSDKRFNVRRGRLKAAYDNGLSLFVIQIDATEKGMAIKDAYLKLTESWIKSFSITTGVFDRPFGYEISYSSSLRESPERSRLFQTIFPGERDLGVKISIQPPKTSKWNILKIEGGLFSGTGGSTVDFDYQKDFIGNIGINKTTKNEKINFACRFSYYNGGYRQSNKFVYGDLGTLSNGNYGFVVDSTTSNIGHIARREYMGADAQINIDFPLGLTSLRGEYIKGTQPGISSTSVSPSADPTAATYLRNFNGAYFYLVQNILQSKHQLVVKYDYYDPNIDVSGDEIGMSGTKLSKTDIKYSTIGFGWIYRWDENVKIIAYCDLVENETSQNLNGFSKDLKDNVFTLRVQYKF